MEKLVCPTSAWAGWAVSARSTTKAEPLKGTRRLDPRVRFKKKSENRSSKIQDGAEPACWQLKPQGFGLPSYMFITETSFKGTAVKSSLVGPALSKSSMAYTLNSYCSSLFKSLMVTVLVEDVMVRKSPLASHKLSDVLPPSLPSVMGKLSAMPPSFWGSVAAAPASSSAGVGSVVPASVTWGPASACGPGASKPASSGGVPPSALITPASEAVAIGRRLTVARAIGNNVGEYLIAVGVAATDLKLYLFIAGLNAFHFKLGGEHRIVSNGEPIRGNVNVRLVPDVKAERFCFARSGFVAGVVFENVVGIDVKGDVHLGVQVRHVEGFQGLHVRGTHPDRARVTGGTVVAGLEPDGVGQGGR